MQTLRPEFASRRRAGATVPAFGRPLGCVLVDQGALTRIDLVAALSRARRQRVPLDRLLLAEDLVTPAALLRAEAARQGLAAFDRRRDPPDPGLSGLVDPVLCLRLGAAPWQWRGATLIVAATSSAAFEALRPALAPHYDRLACALMREADLQAEIEARCRADLALRAETALPADLSCRDRNAAPPRRRLAAALWMLGCGALLVFAPAFFFAAVVLIAVALLCAAEALKLLAICAAWRPRRATPPAPAARRAPAPETPCISLLVPLFRETAILPDLLRRLGRLRYPRAATDVLLILEADDRATRDALAALPLPGWIRIVTVPAGRLKTKPRALNYALPFARGSLIGILDAEDAPSADQLDRIARAFARAPADLVCLQGILDFYNPRANWLSRCFTIEYATWFRLVLPGLCRLGLVIPLGGTTVYFRRAALERVGGWDAHNVTEDADLGLRLARFGYRTEVFPTVTLEEANNRVWPWIRQRSRWHKGYMMTWRVHNRAPRRLWRQLGARRWLGVQVLFLTAWAQFLLAPLIWAFWLIPMGRAPPLPPWIDAAGLAALFLGAHAITLAAGLAAVARSPHRRLMRWVPLLLLYFPLGVAAAYKALWEAVTAPFFWDKTAHGASRPDRSGDGATG
ncbi:glycosyltransferase family 2 protein [Roseivivax sp. CAU 1761]